MNKKEIDAVKRAIDATVLATIMDVRNKIWAAKISSPMLDLPIRWKMYHTSIAINRHIDEIMQYSKGLFR